MKSSRIVAIVLWSLLFISLLAEEVFFLEWTRAGTYNLFSTIVFTLFIFGWFLADASERGHSPSLLLKIAVVAVGVLAVPFYKFRYFGPQAGFTFIGIVVLAFIATIAATYLVEMIVH